MSGLLLLGVIALWVAAVRWLARKLATFLPDKPWRRFVQGGLAVLLIPLPLVDEIVAASKFQSLCKEKSAVIVDVPNPRGRTVWFDAGERTQMTLGGIRIVEARSNYIDPKSHELIYHYFRLEADGGWLVRRLRI